MLRYTKEYTYAFGFMLRRIRLYTFMYAMLYSNGDAFVVYTIYSFENTSLKAFNGNGMITTFC